MSERKKNRFAPGSLEGARSATGSEPGASGAKRWSANRKKEVVLRLLRGESVDTISREFGVEIYRLDQWRERALAALDSENSWFQARLFRALGHRPISCPVQDSSK